VDDTLHPRCTAHKKQNAVPGLAVTVAVTLPCAVPSSLAAGGNRSVVRNHVIRETVRCAVACVGAAPAPANAALPRRSPPGQDDP